MRTVPPALAARIESGATALCHAWIVSRPDGLRLGFTDHDRDLVVDGVVCAAASGWSAGAAQSELGFSPGLASAAGALSSDAIDAADVEAGLFDGAGVEAWRLDWSEPGLKVLLWRGSIARLVRGGEAFTAEIEGPLAALERVAGRTYGRGCDASLGDARCGVDLAALPGAVCDKRFATCAATFANAINFQGFPTIPGEDFLAAYPATGERHDGSRR